MADKKVVKVVKSTKEKSPKAKTTTSTRSLRGSGKKPETKQSPRQDRHSGVRRIAMTKKQRPASGLAVSVFDIHGKSAGTITLPKEVFGQKPNPQLLAQAIRVYQANQIPHTAHTKTRGEVRGGGTKPWRQKGTGRARAGSIRSPLWRGGGITFGPRFKDVKLSLPKKMKHKALGLALSDKAQAGSIRIISGIEKISPKTKVVANLLKKLEIKGNTLLIISPNPPTGGQNVNLASRNIPNLQIDTPPNLNAYEILKNRQLLISKEALAQFK